MFKVARGADTMMAISASDSFFSLCSDLFYKGKRISDTLIHFTSQSIRLNYRLRIKNLNERCCCWLNLVAQVKLFYCKYPCF